MTPDAPYPATLVVDYSDAPRDRLSVLLRIFFAVPIVIIAAAISGGGQAIPVPGEQFTLGVASGGGTRFLAPLLMILFRRKYPRWWFDWNLALLRLETRVAAYL